jgi:hypothetical protein
MFSAMNYQDLFIIFCLDNTAKQAVSWGICGGYVGVTPGRKQEVHAFEKIPDGLGF